MTNTALALWSLLFLFVLRVAGQLLVAIGAAPWLPPMRAWYAGLVPYGPLLVSQLAIVAVYAKASLDVTRGRGFFADPRPALGRALTIAGVLYLAGMAVRYWLQGPGIPVAFHCVLAAFLLVLGAHHRRRTAL